MKRCIKEIQRELKGIRQQIKDKAEKKKKAEIFKKNILILHLHFCPDSSS